MSQINRDTEKRSLPFFGIGKVLPYMKKYAKVTILMVTCGLASTGVDLLSLDVGCCCNSHIASYC